MEISETLPDSLYENEIRRPLHPADSITEVNVHFHSHDRSGPLELPTTANSESKNQDLRSHVHTDRQTTVNPKQSTDLQSSSKHSAGNSKPSDIPNGFFVLGCGVVISYLGWLFLCQFVIWPIQDYSRKSCEIAACNGAALTVSKIYFATVTVTFCPSTAASAAL